MGIIDKVKDISELVKKLGNTELYKKIGELKSEIIELTREKNTLTEENQELIKTLNISSDMIFNAPLYYMSDDPVPYCPKCWEVNYKAVHLIKNDELDGKVEFICLNCAMSVWI